MIARGAVLLAACAVLAGEGRAQDVDTVPPVRHILAIDYARLKPFRRSFDVTVAWADSLVPIGRRDVSLEVTVSDSTAGWLLVETRTGAVNSVDSIYFASDLRPTLWHSMIGGAKLAMTFTADSMQGSIRVGQAASRSSIAIPPDLIVSGAGFEMIAPLLPLAEAWSDTASTLAVTLAGATVGPVQVTVFGTDSLTIAPDLPARPTWVVAMRAGAHESRVWVDRETGDVLRAQQLLPSHVGAVLEYRMRSQLISAP